MARRFLKYILAFRKVKFPRRVRTTLQIVTAKNRTSFFAFLKFGGYNGSAETVLSRPYLLLDVRPEDSYERGHLATALPYPQSRLIRCMDFETRQMLAFKNREKRIIVLYDEDESVAAK